MPKSDLRSLAREANERSFTHDVFISYAREGNWAQVREGRRPVLDVLKRALELHRHPASKRPFRACTDAEGMAVGKDLSRTIAECLDQSRCLLVICDEVSKGNYWVKWEIESFLESRRDALQAESSPIIGARLRLAPCDAFPSVFDAAVRFVDLLAKPDMPWRDYRRAIEMQSHQIVAWVWNLHPTPELDDQGLEKRLEQAVRAVGVPLQSRARAGV